MMFVITEQKCYETLLRRINSFNFVLEVRQYIIINSELIAGINYAPCNRCSYNYNYTAAAAAGTNGDSFYLLHPRSPMYYPASPLPPSRTLGSVYPCSYN